MKKTIIGFCLFISILGAQFDLGRFNGESLHYDLVWAGINVGEADINIAFIENDLSRMKLICTVKTIGWARFIFSEEDSIYTEFHSSSGDLIYTYRASCWSFLGRTEERDKIIITKTDTYMTYRYERTGLPHREKSWYKSIIIDGNFLLFDLQDIVASGMIIRSKLNGIDDYYYFNILGEVNDNLVPKIFPLWIEGRDMIEINGKRYRTLKCHVRPIDTSKLFPDPNVIVWVTDDPYRLLVQVRANLTVPILGKETVTAVLNTNKSIVPYWQSNK